MEDQDQPALGVRVKGRIDKRQLAALFARADELIDESGGPRFRSGIGAHGRLGRTLLEELFSRARVIQGPAKRGPDPSQTQEVAKPTTTPESGVLDALDEAIDRVAAQADAPSPEEERRRAASERLTGSVVGSVLARLEEVLGNDEPAPAVSGWGADSHPELIDELPDDPAVPTLEQLNQFLTESTDDEAGALRTYLEDLEMPEPAKKGELDDLLSRSDEIQFEGYEQDLERLLIETYERYRSVPDRLKVDPKRSHLDLLDDAPTLEEQRAELRAERRAEQLDRPRTHQTEQLPRPPRPGAAPAGLGPAAAPQVDPFQLDPFANQPGPAARAPGTPTPRAPATPTPQPGAEVDPFKLDPFTGRPLAEGEAPQVMGPPPSGVHNLPKQPPNKPLFPSAPPGGFYAVDGPPLIDPGAGGGGGLPFSAEPLPAAGFPPRDPFAGAGPPSSPFPTSPTQPSPSQTGGFNPMEDPGSAARPPTGPPPERTPARGFPRPYTGAGSPLTPGVPPIYPVESGEFDTGRPQLPMQSADPRQAFEQQLQLTGLRGMLERANPPRGQPKSTPVMVQHDKNRNVFRAPLHPRLEAGDRFQLADGRIYRVLSSELVFLDGSPCFQEAACSKLGHMNAPLRDSWDQT